MSIAVRPTRPVRPLSTSTRATTRPHRRRSLFALDLTALVTAFVLAHLVRFPGELAMLPRAGTLEFLVAPAIVAVWMLLLGLARARDPRIVGVGTEEYRRLLTASAGAGALVAVVAYLADVDLARGYVAVAFPAGLVLLALGRKVSRAVLVRRRTAGERLVDVLLVGDPDDVQYVGRRIESCPAAGYRVRGVVVERPLSAGVARTSAGSFSVIGGADDVLDVARRNGVSAVVVAGAVRGGRDRLRRLGWELESHGIELVVSSPIADVAAARVHQRPVDGLPLMHVETPDYSRRIGKRALDIAGVALGLVLLAPVFGAIALLIRLDDGGPVFFRQTRVGRDNEPFSIVKFRTMCVDAESRVAGLAARNQGAGPLFKLQDDPRVTRVGAFLRRTSLDELPQLWNVLRGEMSLVGPRPALPREVALYSDFEDRRLLVTPGITGLWQVSGRSDLDWADGVRLDQHYVENWSFAHDLVILARTIPSVLRSRGAY